METRDWVVLIKTVMGFKQFGPMTSSQLMAQISSGEFKYSDHVWKSGFQSWGRIGDQTEFGATPNSSNPNDAESSQSLSEIEVNLEDVVRQIRMVPDFNLLAPIEEDTFEMIKGLDILDSQDESVEFVQGPSLRATKRLHYSTRKSRSRLASVFPALVRRLQDLF